MTNKIFFWSLLLGAAGLLAFSTILGWEGIFGFIAGASAMSLVSIAVLMRLDQEESTEPEPHWAGRDDD